MSLAEFIKTIASVSPSVFVALIVFTVLIRAFGEWQHRRLTRLLARVYELRHKIAELEATRERTARTLENFLAEVVQDEEEIDRKLLAALSTEELEALEEAKQRVREAKQEIIELQASDQKNSVARQQLKNQVTSVQSQLEEANQILKPVKLFKPVQSIKSLMLFADYVTNLTPVPSRQARVERQGESK